MTERANPPEPTISLSQYLAPLRDHGRIVALVAGLTLVVGVLAAALGPKTYTSTTAVLIYPVSSDPTEALQSIDRSNDMVTESRIANSRSVAQATAEAFQEVTLSVTPETVAANLEATVAEDSRVLDISYTSSDPGVARVGAELAANAYLDYRSQLNEASREAARAVIADQVAELQDQLTDIEAQIGRSVAGSPARLVAEVERDTIEGQLAAHQTVLADLSILALDAATVIDAPREPQSPDGLGPVPLIVGSAAGGLILGLIAAWTMALLTPGPGTDGRTGPVTATAPTSLRTPSAQAGPDGNGGPVPAGDAAQAARDKGSRRLRRKSRDEGTSKGGDDPFDDTDARDPLELIRALDAMEQAEAMLTHRQRSAVEAAQDEPEVDEVEEAAPAEPSFSELYPVEYVSDDSSGEDTDEDPFAPDGTTDEDHAIEQFAADGFDGRDFGAVEEPATESPATESPVDADETDAEETGAALVAFESFDTLPTFDGAAEESAEDVAGELIAGLVDQPTGDVVELPEADAGAEAGAWFEADAPADDIEMEADVEMDAGAEAEVDVEADAHLDAETVDVADEFVEPVGEAIEASLDHTTTGDPHSLDPGPASWDGPFVGPTQWDDLATAAGLTDAGPEGDGGLVASDDADALFEKLSELGAAGPVVVLSLGDRDPAAGLTAGFELADELRALGARILLIDARLDQPVLDSLFDDGAGVGLAQVMTGEVLLRNGVRSLPGLDGLDLLTVGSLDEDTAAHLTGPAFERLLAEARMDYHSIVIIGDTVASDDPASPVDRGRTEALAVVADGLVVGTGNAAGTPADEQLSRALATLAAPVLQLTAATVPTAGEPVATSGS